MSVKQTGDTSAKPCDIRDIIRHKLVRSYFQCIIDLKTSRSLGFEALVRTSPGIVVVPPDDLFSQAQQHNCVHSLDSLCLFTALSCSRTRKLEGLIFINVLPQNLAMLAQTFAASTNLKSLQGVVLEISERYPLENFEVMSQHLQSLRRCGAKIAIDDLGAGYAGLKSWSQIRPDFVKIDQHFIQGIDSDGVKREFVRSILEIARGMACQVVAEGIETRQELETLFSLGVTIGQGYLLHRPEPEPGSLFIKEELDTRACISRDQLFVRPAGRVGSILRESDTVASRMPASVALKLFSASPGLHSLPVIDKGEPVGILCRSNLIQVCAEGTVDTDKLHVAAVMERSPVVVDIREDLDSVSQQLTAQTDSDLNKGFIITDKGRYTGVASVTELLRAITQNKNSRDRYSNPLTHLPGSVPVYEWLEDLLATGEPFSLAFIGLNNFKPYNEAHGYSKGDSMLNMVADILIRHTLKDKGLAGHFGADNFVVIFRGEHWQQGCRSMLQDFDRLVDNYLTEEERTNGKLVVLKATSASCTPLLRSCNLPSMAIGAVRLLPKTNISCDDLVALANDAKHKAMQQDCNYVHMVRAEQVQQVNNGVDENKR